MRKFIVVSIIPPEFPQEFPDQDWPPHVTLLGSFATHLPVAELSQRLSAACARHAPIEVRGATRQMFGPNLDVPVTEVWRTDALAALRSEIMQRFGTDVEYASRPYPTYRPHVTDQRGGTLAVGATARLESISLIEKDSERRIVVCTSPLAGSQNC